MNERTRQEGQLTGYIKGLRKAFKHFDYLLEEIDFSKSFFNLCLFARKGTRLEARLDEWTDVDVIFTCSDLADKVNSNT